MPTTRQLPKGWIKLTDVQTQCDHCLPVANIAYFRECHGELGETMVQIQNGGCVFVRGNIDQVLALIAEAGA